jgi:hypothetical protein
MLADVAVAVNPNDERYKDLVGRTVMLPLVNIEIPIIADEYSDPTFGTGAVKITPAHDANDFDVGNGTSSRCQCDRREWFVREVMDAAGRVPDSVMGLDRFEAREKVVQAAEGRRFPGEGEKHRHSIRRCYRCDTVVEPRLSEQWFVKTKPLADRPSRRARRDDQDPPRALGGGLHQLARGHPRLEHLEAALVGTSHSRLVLRRVRSREREPREPGALPRVFGSRAGRTRTCSTRGSRQASGRLSTSGGLTRPRTCAPSIRRTR